MAYPDLKGLRLNDFFDSLSNTNLKQTITISKTNCKRMATMWLKIGSNFGVIVIVMRPQKVDKNTAVSENKQKWLVGGFSTEKTRGSSLLVSRKYHLQVIAFLFFIFILKTQWRTTFIYKTDISQPMQLDCISVI